MVIRYSVRGGRGRRVLIHLLVTSKGWNQRAASNGESSLTLISAVSVSMMNMERKGGVGRAAGGVGVVVFMKL